MLNIKLNEAAILIHQNTISNRKEIGRMRILRKFKCAICGCEAANYRSCGRYCQKCRLIYDHRGGVHKIFAEMANNPKFSISKFFHDTVASMSTLAKQRIAKQLGEFPKTYDEQSKLDAERVKQAEKDAENIAKASTNNRRNDTRICACCGEEFKIYGNPDSKNCGVCWNVFGQENLKHVSKLPDERKCELYKIRRAGCNDEVKSMTPPSLHQNLRTSLNIRLQPTGNVVMAIMRAKMADRMRESEKHKKIPFTCCSCGSVYLLEEEQSKPFICDRCKAYDEEHRSGTKLRDIPGLPSMTYEHLALLPEYAACAFTKHMTAKELERLKTFKTKIKPPRRSFTELIDDV